MLLFVYWYKEMMEDKVQYEVQAIQKEKKEKKMQTKHKV